jgi:dTDP-glucose pyrophosphorylase
MLNIQEHTIQSNASVLEAFEKLNHIPNTLTLFILDDQERLVGTLSDGDIRRGFLSGLTLNDKVTKFMFTNFSALRSDNCNPDQINPIKKRGVKLLPILDSEGKIKRVIDFGKVKTILPVDVVLMAGGRGERLRPLTDTTPKPLLKVGNKPIIEHNIDRLSEFGIRNFHISIGYLGEQIETFFKNGEEKGVSIEYIKEVSPLGTFGSVKLIKNVTNNNLLVMNSDLFTNIDYEDFYQEFIHSGADMAIATIPYVVDIPYAVLDIEENSIKGFREKPRYTYFSNAGIYLVKQELLSLIPPNIFFNATDFIQKLIDENKRIVRFPILGYWVDIGRHEDYIKVQEMVKHIHS